MFVALRGGLTAKLPISGITKELCKKNNVLKFQVATLTRASKRDESEIPLIKPFPYHEKEYTVFRMLMDTNKNRMHKHSKVIVVDGQIATGKTKLAKELAKEFDFLFLPQPTFDDLYVTPWGLDIRTLDHKLPKAIQSWDIERWNQDPHDINTAAMQSYMFLMRQARWMECLAHVLMTGQGVVTVRSPWVNHVFSKAMYQSKHLSGPAFEDQVDCELASLWHYLKPHLIIYLDTSVENTMNNIKKRGRPYEQNSKALTEKFISDVEESYKRDYLAKLSEHSLLLIYDWTNGGDTEVVVSDIEGLNFDDYHINDAKLHDWRFFAKNHKLYAKHFTYDSDMLLHNMDIVRTDVPEMLASGNDMAAWNNFWEEIPDLVYNKGYNPHRGDTVMDMMMKTKNYLYPAERVEPLIKKYYERKAAMKAAGAQKN